MVKMSRRFAGSAAFPTLIPTTTLELGVWLDGAGHPVLGWM